MSEHGKINILIVDDKPDKVLALEAVLEDLGQNVVRAYSGREALRCLLNQDFAVILLDVNMPGMDGFETASLIRQRSSTQGVPIIFVTAMNDETHVQRGYSIGAVDYIQTPVVPDVLKTKVAVFVDLYRKSEQVRLQAECLRQQAAQLHKLTAASIAINSALSMEQMFRVVTDTARDIAGAHRARAILFVGDEPTSVICSDAEEAQVERLQEYRPDRFGLHALVCRMNKSIRMSRRELEDHPAWGELASDTGHWHPTGGWLAAPLSGRDGRNLGLIEICDKALGDFSEDDESALVQLAQMCSIAVENTIYAAERETNRIKDEFLSTLSHELRTPLNAILGWTQLLRIEQLPPETAHGLEVIDRNARAQTKLIEDLLDVSRITTGKLQLNLRPTVLGPVIQAAADAVRPTVEARHITVDCKLEGAETIVEGDADRLQQVCWNLFSNAAKFTPERGRITVRLEASDGVVHLTVNDTGRGIDPAFLPFVFDRFRQADSTSTRSHGGLGIGLTIVRRIVQLHGGSVEAQSEGVGCGATFTVTLPIAPANGAARRKSMSNHAPADASAPVDLRGMRILLVDDEPDAREVAATALARAGAAVTQAGSVDEALAAFDQVRPDVLVTDIAMPDKDGYDLLREVRRRPPAEGSDVPAIALTAYARAEDRARALAAGFQHHLVKPVNPPMLARIVGQIQKAPAPV